MKELRRNPADAALVVGRHRKRRGTDGPTGITEERFVRADAGTTSSVSRLRRYFPLIRTVSEANEGRRGNTVPVEQLTEQRASQPLTQIVVAQELPTEDRAVKDERFGFVTMDISQVIAHVSENFAYPMRREQKRIFVVLEGENVGRFQELTNRGTRFHFVPERGASYDSTHKIIFATPEAAKEPRAKQHEATHAVVDAINPELMETANHFFDTLFAHTNGEPVPVEINAQHAQAAAALHEGLAVLEELEVYDTIEAAQAYRADMLHGPYRQLRNRRWINEQFALLEESTQLYERALAEPDPARSGHLAQLAYKTQNRKQFISKPRYVVGFFLVDGVLTALKEAGIPDDEIPAWKQRIARSDPQTLDEFRNPKAYLQKLQAATLTDL